MHARRKCAASLCRADSPIPPILPAAGWSTWRVTVPKKPCTTGTEYQQELTFSAGAGAQVEYAIALRSLFAKTEAHIPWLQEALTRLEDDKLVEIRLRWALAEQDWAALEQTLPLLSEEKRGDSAWRYWQAMAMEQRGRERRGSAAGSTGTGARLLQFPGGGQAAAGLRF